MVYEIGKDGRLHFYDYKFCERAPRIGLKIDALDAGKYYIVIVTPNCEMKKSPDLEGKRVDVVNRDGRFSDRMVDCLRELFQKYDVMMKNYLDYFQFGSIFELFDISIGEGQFRERIVNKYGVKGRGVNFFGFCRFFHDLYQEVGETIFRIYLKRLGYDDSLFCSSSRNFVINFHT
jgi:hypothetical protein